MGGSGKSFVGFPLFPLPPVVRPSLLSLHPFPLTLALFSSLFSLPLRPPPARAIALNQHHRFSFHRFHSTYCTYCHAALEQPHILNASLQVVFTDGQDNASSANLSDVVAKISKPGISNFNFVCLVVGAQQMAAAMQQAFQVVAS